MRLRVLDVVDVAEVQMCTGCGACAGVKPGDIGMVDTYEFGRRPVLKRGEASRGAAREAMAVCPGIGLEHEEAALPSGFAEVARAGWGPVLEVWEGYATDPEIRYKGSSGGAASAIALYCIERGGMHGLLHIAAREDVPYLNRTVLSRTRAEIVGATGSRYAPASPCEGLGMVKEAPGACVMIGKPCDVGAAGKARRLDAELDRKLGLTIGIFCAGTPTTKGTVEMMRAMGVSAGERVVGVRYRGLGWPGRARVEVEGARNGGEREREGGEEACVTPGPRVGEGRAVREMSYDESWGKILQKHRQWRCYVCADHTGEFADIAVGDPWRHPLPEGDPGRSLVVVRSERGRAVVRAAMEAGYLTLERSGAGALEETQPGLISGRGAVWGRVLALRLMGLPAPRFVGLPMLRYWWTKLSVYEKARSIYGTVRRSYTKRLRERHAVVAYETASEAGVECRAWARKEKTGGEGRGTHDGVQEAVGQSTRDSAA
ncbi:MAG: Coenzyme F420 hydrogenase/dehydrogenase, beta subunit C-terminal domain [Phycisphaerales bacterium]